MISDRSWIPESGVSRARPGESPNYRSVVSAAFGAMVTAANAEVLAQAGQHAIRDCAEYTVLNSTFATLNALPRTLCSKMLQAVCTMRGCVPIRRLRCVNRPCRVRWPTDLHQAAPMGRDSVTSLSMPCRIALSVRTPWEPVATPRRFS